MYGKDTGEIQEVHFEHLNVTLMKRLNDKIGELKKRRIWNAVFRLFLNGGHLDEKIETSKVITLDD